MLSSSIWGGAATDVIAINSGIRPPGSYLGNVSKYSGSGVYSVMFWENREVMGVPTSPTGGTSTAIGLNFAGRCARCRCTCRPAQGFRVNHHTDMRGVPGRQHARRAEHVYPQPHVAGERVRRRGQRAVADRVGLPGLPGAVTGWYSVILIWNTPWTAAALQRRVRGIPAALQPGLGDPLNACPAPGP